MKLRTIIVEDEINNQELLCKLLNDYCSDIEVFGNTISVIFYSVYVHCGMKIIEFYVALFASKQVFASFHINNLSVLSKITFPLDIAQYDPWKTIDRLNF